MLRRTLSLKAGSGELSRRPAGPSKRYLIPVRATPTEPKAVINGSVLSEGGDQEGDKGDKSVDSTTVSPAVSLLQVPPPTAKLSDKSPSGGGRVQQGKQTLDSGPGKPPVAPTPGGSTLQSKKYQEGDSAISSTATAPQSPTAAAALLEKLPNDEGVAQSVVSATDAGPTTEAGTGGATQVGSDVLQQKLGSNESPGGETVPTEGARGDGKPEVVLIAAAESTSVSTPGADSVVQGAPQDAVDPNESSLASVPSPGNGAAYNPSSVDPAAAFGEYEAFLAQAPDSDEEGPDVGSVQTGYQGPVTDGDVPVKGLVYVGQMDTERFELHPSVKWVESISDDTFAREKELLRNTNTPQGLLELQQYLSRRLQEAGVLDNFESVTYWAYSVTKLAFFFTQVTVAWAAAQAQQRAAGSQAIDQVKPADPIDMYGRMLQTFWWDLKAVQNGDYVMPWDVETPQHMQHNPLVLARTSARLFPHLTRIFYRDPAEDPRKLWLESSMYPSYYKQRFHFQQDGWLSSESADVYESFSESYFQGMQDAMQRSALVPLKRFFTRTKKSQSECHVLELGCGTGRFLTFVKDNYPLVKATAMDLSPFFLEKARDNMLYWRETRQPRLDIGGYQGTGVTFWQAKAEECPLEDASVDVVVCVYLFHELPRPVRVQVLEQAWRVLRPGGMFILTDSAQLGEAAHADQEKMMFTEFNEPHYLDYLQHDLGGAMEAVGFECDMKVAHYLTKTLSAVKPVTSS